MQHTWTPTNQQIILNIPSPVNCFKWTDLSSTWMATVRCFWFDCNYSTWTSTKCVSVTIDLERWTEKRNPKSSKNSKISHIWFGVFERSSPSSSSLRMCRFINIVQSRLYCYITTFLSIYWRSMLFVRAQEKTKRIRIVVSVYGFHLFSLFCH